MRTVRAIALAAVAAGSAALALGYAARVAPLGPWGPGLRSVARLARLETPASGKVWLGLLAVAFLGAALRGRLRGLGDRGPATAVVGASLAAVALSTTFELGHLVLVLFGAAATGAAAGLLGLEPRAAALRMPGAWALPLALHLAVAVPMAAAAFHRHRAFGSGSWDLGCMVHNLHLASRGHPLVSTVLDGVHVLGDHFMPGIYLFAPLFWVDDSAYMVLGVQAASLAVTAPAVLAIARARGAHPASATALALATGLGFGLQSAAFFDAHAITMGFGLLAGALWAIETGRLRGATALLALFATFKESLGPYAVGLGLWLGLRGLRTGCRRDLRYGAAWALAGTAWFVVVVRVLMPHFAARGLEAPESHETFADFGPTVFLAFLDMLSDPVKALGALFVPGEKALALGVTLAGVGGFALASPSVGLAALPLLAERFLSSKATMWQMGYHYAAPLTLYAGWAAARALPRCERAAGRALSAFAARPVRGAGAAAVFLLAAGGATNQLGYRHPANLHRPDEPYFAAPAVRRAQAAGVRFVDRLGDEVAVAAQNRLLPHLAQRRRIWRLGRWDGAEVVILSLGESAWPYPASFPDRLAGILEGDPGWRLVFSDGPVRVFARAALAEARGLAPVSAPE